MGTTSTCATVIGTPSSASDFTPLAAGLEQETRTTQAEAANSDFNGKTDSFIERT
jgi:hypothetical protein